MRLRRRDVRRALRLSGELRELEHDPQARARHLVESIAKLVGSTVTTLSRIELGASVNLIAEHGWSEDEQRRAIELYAGGDGANVDPLARFLVASPRPSVAFSRRDVVTDHDWYRSAAYAALRRPIHLDDALYSRRLIAHGTAFMCLALNREQGDRPFRVEDRNLVRVLGDELAILSEPRPRWPVGPPPPWVVALPARLRSVLERLVAGDSEKEIAARLEIKEGTVHQYVVMIYRRADVHNRAQLLARALSTNERS
jgi:DNA-binding CsgD family transcriptional regulator